MEERLMEVDELLETLKEAIISLTPGSDEHKKATEAYLDLAKARAEFLKATNPTEAENEFWEEFFKWIAMLGPFVVPALVKAYEVWARRRTNQEAMYVEEVAAKYIPKTPWNNR